jgi:hypothetical protein
LSLIDLFCRTGGTSNDTLHRWIIRSIPPARFPEAGLLQPGELPVLKEKLDREGYYVFKNRLPDEVCDRLLRFGLSEKAFVKVRENPSAPGRMLLENYDRANPIGVRYEFDEKTILRSPDVQELMADPGILAAAETYLGCKPILDLVACWWHTSFSKQPDHDAAQFFHFDMDRIKWLKFFFYLTDVAPENGPHSFIAKSHRTKGIPKDLLRKGYARLTDQEVVSHFPREDFIEFSAPRGTIIAEDTRGLHKGRHVEAGDRLVFQLEISNSLFGKDYSEIADARIINPALGRMVDVHPEIYTRYFQGRNGSSRDPR